MNDLLKLIFGTVLNIFRIIPLSNHKICFVCNRGNQFCCNPKYLAKEIKNRYGTQYKIIWFYSNEAVKEQAEKEGYCVYKFNGFMYYLSLMTSRYIISNITIPTFVPYRKGQIRLCTWHGTAFKGYTNSEHYNYNVFTHFIAENKLTHDVLRNEHAFSFKNIILDTGMPRNDIFIKADSEKISDIKLQIGIPEQSHIALYAPTFRDNNNDCFEIDFENLKQSLAETFGGDWIIAFRYHPLQKEKNISGNGIDVSFFDDMQELLLITDVLITDYSSCMWDFSLMRKPCFLYASDIEQYVDNERGEFFYPIGKMPFPLAKSYNELCLNIMNFNSEVYQKHLNNYFNEWWAYNQHGDACEKIINLLFDRNKGGIING